jgi:hypothetical protein
MQVNMMTAHRILIWKPERKNAVGEFQLRMADITDLRKCPVATQVAIVFLDVSNILVYRLKADPGTRAV